MARTRAATATARAEATTARLAALAMPKEGRWAREARLAARARLAQVGLPMRRDEYWRQTDPTSLIAALVPRAARQREGKPPVFDAVERLKIVFVDGVFDPEASDPLALEHVEIERLTDAAARDIHWAKDLYGVLEAAGQRPIARPLAALNSAAATDGVVIRVTGAAPKPVALVYRHRAPGSDAILHNVVRLAPGADLTLLEAGPAAARFNNVLEVEVGDGATFHHLRTQGGDHERRAIGQVFARLGAGSIFKSFTLTANGAMTRNETVVEFRGAGAVAHLAGAALGDAGFHQDDTVLVIHQAPGCESRQVFKKVLRNGAQGVFQGKILVHAEAQKTDAYQISQALMLDDDAQFFAKPELEIYADDVQCSHGATSGGIDPDTLFYLVSRGIPRIEAENMLVASFLSEAIGEIEDRRLREDVIARLDEWLRRRRM